MGRHLIGLFAVAIAAGFGATAIATRAAEALAVTAPAVRLRSPTVDVTSCPIPQRFRGEFEAASNDTGLPLSLLLAVATIESNMQEHAVSPRGARGLLQVLPSTAATLKLRADETTENVLAGARYLSLMFDRFASADLALAAYNAGPATVENAYGGVPTIARPYVDAVRALWERYAGCV
jgi:soluble lytic murein transglycosylase-like protein